MADLKRYWTDIKGKPYLQVEGRLVQAHEDFPDAMSICTELVPAEHFVLFRATVTTPKGTFTGWSAADPESRSIEGENPFEVAETSAIGRALKHAGVAIGAGVSAEEMGKAGYAAGRRPNGAEPTQTPPAGRDEPTAPLPITQTQELSMRKKLLEARVPQAHIDTIIGMVAHDAALCGRAYRSLDAAIKAKQPWGDALRQAGVPIPEGGMGAQAGRPSANGHANGKPPLAREPGDESDDPTVAVEAEISEMCRKAGITDPDRQQLIDRAVRSRPDYDAVKTFLAEESKKVPF